MKTAIKFGVSTVALIAMMSATAATAQSLIGRDSIAEDRNEDLVEAIEDDAERELDRFGNEGRREGFTGSVAMRAIAQTGNAESTDIGIGSDLGYVWGPNGIELQLNYAYSDDDDALAGTDESLFYNLEYTRDFTPVTFGFAKVQGSYDGATDAEFETDTFVSFGAGYRIYNDAERQWSLQAGPGYRFANFNDIASADVSEGAFGVSSDYAHKLTETLFLTNDTDVIWSETNTKVFNDLALNVSMTNSLALRTSVLTEYTSDVTAPSKNTDNTFGVSLVYSFN
jgi:putative salt-induced outer membrane protein